MLIPDLVEKTINAPWHLSKGVIGIAATPVRAIAGASYLPVNYTNPVGEGNPASVYDIAKPMLDMNALIYYYAELRSATKTKLVDFAKEKGLSADLNDPNLNRDLSTIYNAINARNQCHAALASVEECDLEKAAMAYRKSLAAIVQLLEQETFKQVGMEDIEVFHIYFTILEDSKDVIKIKNDFELYSTYVDPQFTFGFGGKDFQLETVTDLVKDSSDAVIHHMDDEFAFTSFNIKGAIEGFLSEIVYAIVISETKKRITVVFRGSVSAKDWTMNFQLGMTDFELPGFTSEADKKNPRHKYGRVHKGFYKYLFGETRSNEARSIESKAEEIITKLVELVNLEKYKEFDIFVTGHSLGGSLSTMLAFRAAQDDRLGKKIVNVSFASPYCGDLEFRKEFYNLEKDDRIRHLRITNDEDAVPLFPPAWFNAPTEIDIYKHTGMNIKLFSEAEVLKPKYSIMYPKENSLTVEIRNALASNLIAGLSVGLLSKHLCPEYTDRLDRAKEGLQNITLEGMYSDTNITGW